MISAGPAAQPSTTATNYEDPKILYGMGNFNNRKTASADR